MKRVAFVLLTLAVGIGLAQYDTTLLRQNFDTTWNSANPPGGWTITWNGPDAWRRNTGAPWTADTTGYATAIYQNYIGSDTDTLKTPIIDCSRVRTIVLRCSTFFWPRFPAAYQAHLLYSRDSGHTWQLVKDYSNDSVGPEREVFVLDSTGLISGVQIAWAWTGDLFDINAWCVDNVSLSGVIVQDHDVAPVQILRPYRLEIPHSTFVPEVVIANEGRAPETGVPVYAEATIDDSVVWGPWVQTIPLLAQGAKKTVAFENFTAPSTVVPCTMMFYTNMPQDMNRANDTIRQLVDVSNLDYVYFDDGTATGDGYWPIGGNSGWGLKITPLFYPALIRAGQFNLNTTGGSTYRLMITDVNPADSSPRNVLYESQTMNGVTGWNTDSLGGLGLTINSGSCYLFYIQMGDYPTCAELNHDAQRSPGADYWALNNGAYSADTNRKNGDWMIRCLLDYYPPAAVNYDARALYVLGPPDQISLRPAGQGFAPEVRIDNPGLRTLVNVPVACSISTKAAVPLLLYANSMAIDSLIPGQAVNLNFPQWYPTGAETVQVRMRAEYPGDLNRSNDTTSKTVMVYRPHYTGGPEFVDRYAWIDSDTTGGPVYSWVDTGNTSRQLITTNGDVTSGFALPFKFTYRGNSYANVWVCNNGWMAFSQPNGTHNVNETIPMPSAPLNALMPFWDHLRVVPGMKQSKVWWKTLNSQVAGKRQVVVTWDNLMFYDSTGHYDPKNLISFQVILDERTSIITFQYKHVEGSQSLHNYGRSATVGIDNATGTIGLEYLWGQGGVRGFWPANRLSDSLAIRFYAVGRDIGPVSFVVPAEKIIVPGLIQPRVDIRNFMNLMQPFYAYFLLDSMNDRQAYRDSILINFLPAYYDSVMTFNNWLAPLGTWIIKCSTALAGDQNPANDVIAETISVQPWVQRASIPVGYYNKKVRAGALTYLSPYIYALKGANTNEFWRYNIATDSWDSLPSMPVNPRRKKNTKDGASLAAYNGKIYALKGATTREFYVYDPVAASWSTGDSVPYGPNFKGVNAGACMVGGTNDIYMLKGGNTGEFYIYIPPLDNWQSKPGPNLTANTFRFKTGTSIDFCNDTLLYVPNPNSISFVKYNIGTSTWTAATPVPGGPNNTKVRAGSGSAIINDTLLLLKGGNTTELWGYDLIGDRTWRQLSDIPQGTFFKRVKTGGAVTAAGNLLYAFKGGSTSEFWAYAPGGDAKPLALAGKRSGPEDNGTSRVSIVFACRAEPNPSRGPLTIRLAIPEPTNARVRVYDIMGKAVSTIFDGALPAGYQNLTWGRRDQQGRTVASGVYILRFESDAHHTTQKLIIE